MPEQCASSRNASDGWERDGDHALQHSTGWTIARYKVDEVRVYLLWSPVGSVAKYGPFDSADVAKRQHAELISVDSDEASQQEGSEGGTAHG
jgi:hypothetical protein